MSLGLAPREPGPACPSYSSVPVFALYQALLIVMTSFRAMPPFLPLQVYCAPGACTVVCRMASAECCFSRRDARLYVTGNGQGSPCLDLRRVPDTLADATVGTDLVIVEGMGRAIHTNYK